jgi:Tol biopolymer transport system component/DNA-binding winged helix-turn-helix (wHTH) protein
MVSGPERRPQSVIRFGDFILDPVRGTLSRQGVRLKLQPQPRRILELLIERAPGILSREDIQRGVWGDDVNVDVEQNLNFCIRQIRVALIDGSKEPRFIETVPRLGYRFIAPIQREIAPAENPILPERPVAQDAPAETVPDAPLPSLQQWHLWKWLSVIAAIAIAIVVAGVAGVRWSAMRRGESHPTRISYVTTYPGDELDPSLSPDGSQVAFSWGGNRNENRDIYVLPVGGQNPLRLTQDPADDTSPAWSPDGRSIAFVRRYEDGAANVMLIPALGGPERSLCSFRLAKPVFSVPQRKLAWSPNGKWLIFTQTEPTGNDILSLLSLESGAVRSAYPRSDARFEDANPAFSADGRWLAFARFHSPGTSTILIQRITDRVEPEGKPVAVTNVGPNPHSPAWNQDGKRLLFIDGHSVKEFEIGGSTSLVYDSDSEFHGLTVGVSRIIAVRSSENSDIFVLPLQPGGLAAAGPPSPLIQSTAINRLPRYSPDGSHLAYVSYRSGSGEIWVADADGQNERQLTNLRAHIAGFPRWSPDGKRIAFHARVPSHSQIYVLDVASGIPRQLTNDSSDSGTPSWSSDGKSLFISKMTTGEWSLFKIPSVGGAEHPLFAGPGAFPITAPGRRLVLYSKMTTRGIFARTLDDQDSGGAVEEELVDDYLPPFGGIYPVEDGFYYNAGASSGAMRAFRFYSFETKRSVDIAPAPSTINLGLAVSPDRRRLAYCAENEGNADLILLERK